MKKSELSASLIQKKMTSILSESRVSNNPDAPFLLSDDSIYTEANSIYTKST